MHGVGAHHGRTAWLLLVALAQFVVLGVMNLAAMVVLAAVVLAENLWVHAELLVRIIGMRASPWPLR